MNRWGQVVDCDEQNTDSNDIMSYGCVTLYGKKKLCRCD